MKKYITIKELAKFHELDEGYIMEFIHYGIIPVQEKKTILQVHLDDVEELERAIRLNKDLEVNMQGVEIICRLRNRLVELQERLLLYELNKE